jgi:hypothetical protein
MPMRRTIGISLACLVTSACAIAETPEESTTQSISVTPGNAEIPIKSPSFACGAEERWAADYGSELSKDGRAGPAPRHVPDVRKAKSSPKVVRSIAHPAGASSCPY